MKGKSSVVSPVPLRVVRPRSEGGESDCRELALVGPTSAFRLPLDWLIEEKPRQNSLSCPGKIDRYYIEPHTGRKFRSLPAVERYLTDGTIDTRASRRPNEQEKKPKIQITTLAIGSSSDFVLPDGWRTEGHQRHNSPVIDKYYIEPKTGRKFRSMISVKRYLQLQELEADEISAGSPELEGPSVIEKQIVPRSTTCSPDFVLPEGWIIKKQHRRGRRFSSNVDKYYVDPETGQQFRSLVAVERYLKEKEEHEYSMTLKEFKRPNKRHVSLESKSTNESQETSPEISPQKVLDSHPTKSEENRTKPEEVVPDNDSGPSEHSDTPKKSETGEETEAAVDDFGCPPSTINWVLAGPAGDMWNPYLGEFMVPESTKQRWSETFISSLHDEK